MSTITPNLGLVIEDGVTRASRQNLLKIDRLGGGFQVSTDGSIYVRPTSGTNIILGTGDDPAGTIEFHATTVDFSDVDSIIGLNLLFSDLDFTNSSLTSISDYDSVISANTDVAAGAAHILRTDNPHGTSAHQVGTYTSSEIDALIAGAGGSTYNKETYIVTSTDLSNGYLTLNDTPALPASSFILVQGAPSQAYGYDYSIIGSQLNFLDLPGLEDGDVIEVFIK